MSRPLPSTVPYGTDAIELPGAPFRLHLAPVPRPVAPALPPDRVRSVIEHPTTSPGPEEIFRGARRVLVVVSDGTRRTESSAFLPPLVDCVLRASRAEISFAVASGIHRPPTAQEIARILGPELLARHPVIVHDPDDSSRLVEIGRTRAGTPVRVNSAVREHDRVVLTGSVGFHYYAGFSGGRKALVPGLASRETITCNHLRALRTDGSRHPAARAGRLGGNPVHADMAEGAELAGPHLLVNSVVAEDGGIERLFAGHWRRAHESACRYVRRTRTVRLAPLDLVVVAAGGEPSDINLIQSHKAFEAAIGALKPGGVLVLIARCREGEGHPDFLPFFRLGGEDAIVEALRTEFRVYGQTALSWFRKARSCRLILVSDLPRETARLLGATPAVDLDEAFRLAREWLPPGADGWLLPSGSRLFVEPAGGSEPERTA